MKKLISLSMAVIMILSCTFTLAFATDDVEVNVRIEGSDKCYFYGEVMIEDGSTVVSVLEAADRASEELDITIVDGDWGEYITQINGEKENQYNDMDGWNFLHNSVAPSQGIGSETVTEGSQIVVYYGSSKTQIPFVDSKDTQDGNFTFYSNDTTYDDNWNAVVTMNPVCNYTLIWDNTEVEVGETGEVQIPKAVFTEGIHMVQIVKNDENGMMTALRLPDDYAIVVDSEFATQEEEETPNFFQKIINAIKSIFEKIIDVLLGFLK